MDIKSLGEIIEKLEEKSKKIKSKISDIKNLNKDKFPMTDDNIEMINSINQNLNIIDDKCDDFFLEVLKIQNYNSLTSSDKELLREAKFQEVFKKTLLPYVLYLRLCMEL